MRTLAITFGASLAGWLAGILSGNVGGLILALTMHDPRWAWDSLTTRDIVWSEISWTVVVTVGMLPPCVFLVCPLVYSQLRKPARWRPLKAFWIGGAGGVVAFALWLGVLSLSSTPINWSRPDDRAAAAMLVVAAFLIGATTGAVAASMAQSDPGASTPPPLPGSVPPPLPRYDY